MYNHAWAPALLCLTHILNDCNSADPETKDAAIEALGIEGLVVGNVEQLVDALESICDCSFRV